MSLFNQRNYLEMSKLRCQSYIYCYLSINEYFKFKYSYH